MPLPPNIVSVIQKHKLVYVFSVALFVFSVMHIVFVYVESLDTLDDSTLTYLDFFSNDYRSRGGWLPV